MTTKRAKTSEDAREGWHGWDAYAPFYDWENRRTRGIDDVAFWQRLARERGGPVLELGCGTGRILAPVARTGVSVVGIDRSPPMLARAGRRLRRARVGDRAQLVRGDIRRLPFGSRRRFQLVMAPYGIVQSLVRQSDLTSALASVAGVLGRGGVFALDLVPDVPAWGEYSRRVAHRGRGTTAGSRITLIESVRQDRRRKLTIFDEEYIERRGQVVTRRRFELAFRTVTMPEMMERLSDAGFTVDRFLGDYDGSTWELGSPAWIIVATKR